MKRLGISNAPVLAAVLMMALVLLRAAPVGAQSTVAASDGGHLWLVTPRTIGPRATFRLAHHPAGLDPGAIVDVLPLDEAPAALVAHEGEVFMIFRPVINGTVARPFRPVTAVRAVFDPVLRQMRYEPLGRSRTVDSLPGDGRLLAVSSGQQGPLALLGPDSEAPERTANPPDDGPADETARLDGRSAGPSRDEPSGDPASDADAIRLYQLQTGRWKRLPLPEDLGEMESWSLLDAPSPTLIGFPETEGQATALWRLEDGRSWHRVDGPPLAGFIGSARVFKDQIAVALRGESPGTLRIGLLRGTRLYPIATIADRSPDADLLALGQHLVVVDRPEANEPMRLLGLDPLSGATLYEVGVHRPTPHVREDFGPLILIGGLIVAALVMYLFRPDPTSVRVTLPAGTVLAEPQRRLLAVIVDFVPAAVLSLVILGESAASLVYFPMMGRNLDDMLPFLLAVGLTVAHSTAMELATGRTLGKWFMDCRVVSVSGERARAWQVLVRNAMKIITLIIPPLALFVFMNPFRQRLGDLAARTIVVVDLPPAEDGRPGA